MPAAPTQVSPSAAQVLVSFNPMAGKGGARPVADELLDRLSMHGYVAQLVTSLPELARKAEALLGEGSLRCVVGVGGDGTAHEIVNRTPRGTPLVLLPQGTENLLAKYMGTGTTPKDVADVIRQGWMVRLDAGRAVGRALNTDDKHDRLFILMSSCGFDADVIVKLHQRRTGNISHLSYLMPILHTALRYRYPAMRLLEAVTADGTPPLPEVVHWMFLFNLPCYAFGLKFAPQANGGDGCLDLCTFARGSTCSTLRYLWALLRQRHGRVRDCRQAQIRKIRVESQAQVYYQLDGEPAGRLPLDLEVVPERLTLLVPPGWTDRRPQAAGATE